MPLISRKPSTRIAGEFHGLNAVWLLASALVAACSFLAPSDEYYLGEPGEEGGGGGRSGAEAGTGGDSGVGPSGGQAGAEEEVAGARAASIGGHGASASSGAGGSSGNVDNGPVTCRSDFADCNHQASDGCEVDLSTSSEHCGGCGEAFTCKGDEACERKKCVSLSGCSDRTREAFLPIERWPRIAGCTAQWPRSSLRAAKTGRPCGFGHDVCEVPADACGVGWHVCASVPYGPAEVSSQATQEECAAQPGAFVAAVGDQSCEPCSEVGDGAACCGGLCVQQNGDCIYPGMTAWFGVYNEYTNLCGAIESDLDERGVLCCRAP